MRRPGFLIIIRQQRVRGMTKKFIKNREGSIAWQTTLVCFLLLAIAVGVWRLAAGQTRYTLFVQDAGREIYVFDTHTGKLFITSADTVRAYGDEMWAQLDPHEKGKAVALKVYLDQQQKIALRQRILQEQQPKADSSVQQKP